MSSDAPYDVVIVGAGVVGCAIARDLSRRPLRVAVLDAANDVGSGTSKANTAILHTGFDATPGTLEARLVRRGHASLSAYAAAVGIPVEPVGALLVAWSDEEENALPALAAKAAANGVDDVRLVPPAEVRRLEPNLGAGARGGLVVPGEQVICPWTTTLAYATEAVAGGVDLFLEARLRSVSGDGDEHVLTIGPRELRTRFLVNAAGLGADRVDRMLGHDRFTVTPRRGELIVYDKLARGLVRHIVLPVPTRRGKGVLVAPTVFGNVMLGPTADDVGDPAATETTAAGLAALVERGARIVPALVREEVTAAYAGLRAATEQADYQFHAEPEQRYVCVGGIRSTGLSASGAIAEHVAGLLAGCGLELGEAAPPLLPAMPNLGEARARPYERGSLIAADPAYGEIVCHCERVTRGEIRDAFASPLPPRDLGGLRRRTRAQMGRCGGFYCGAEVRALLEAATR